MFPSMMYGYGYDYYYPFSHILNWVFWIVFIFLIISLLRRSRGWRHPEWWQGPGHERAIDILKERFAKGEITKEQFEEMKKEIAKH